MPPKSRPANSKWLIIFSLTIDYELQAFAPKSTHTLVDLQRSKHQCNCAYLSNIHPSADWDDIHRGFRPSRTHKARFLFTSDAKLERARELCVTGLGQKHENKRKFRIWMLSLVAQLSELCESDHSQGRFQALRDFTLRPFKTGEITQDKIRKDVSAMLQTPLNPNELKTHGMGYVYVLRDQMGASTIGELKIGFSKFHPEHRAHELARCLARPEVISHTPLLPHAKRLESIIHTELQAVRKIQPCPKCEHNHQEWFIVSHLDSREVVFRWSRWILQRPYVDGKLTDKWKAYLSTMNMESVNEDKVMSQFWQDAIDGFNEDDPQDTESQRIGEYLNDCYWDFTCELIGIDQYGKDFCDDMRKDMPTGREGRGYTKEDMGNSISRLAEMLQAYQEADDSSSDIKPDEPFDYGSELITSFTASVNSHTPLEQISKDALLSSLIDMETPLGSRLHSETRVRHIFNHDNSPGILLRLMMCGQESSRTPREADLLRRVECIKALRTGAVSVSDSKLGITESPLGDATMLPVLALKDLEYLNVPVANWVGMTPTNTGFQLLQDAYKEGKWVGNRPQFKLPKAFRKAGYETLSAEGPTKRPSAKSGHRTSSNPEHDPNSNSKGNSNGATFKFTRGPDRDTFSWSEPMTDEFMQKVNETVEELRNGGREKEENDLARAF
ncbi:hypothetical protein BKA66DRAFT_595273 [Pyrenochaeta sp. MPI-SDFR-AT-0127]|nr:hypothetical protein BKA66DRAFT_595273 [Pyrenochaeta sp. MPI-SDFR-AT-0127]